MEIDDVIVKSEDSPSEDRSDRLEEPWSEKHDRYLTQMKLECVETSSKHAQRAARCRYMYLVFAIPSICLPLASSFAEEAVGAPLIVSRSLLLLGSATSACAGVFNYGRKAQKHEQFAGLYKDLSESISYVLTRSKRCREACDVTMQKYLHKHHLLGASAPAL